MEIRKEITPTKKVLFITATRADFGKLKSLIKACAELRGLDVSLFVTGMHMLSKYGFTAEEVFKAGFRNIYTFINQTEAETMDLILANTIGGLSRFVHETKPDMIVVHGDRIEAMAGAIVGALHNIFVAHIEGGEVSGTVDGLIRHSVSKLSHLHFVSNTQAADRLRQLGESPDAIFNIGSPDIDVMLSPDLPELDAVKAHYQIKFHDYRLVLFHPVTTEHEYMATNAQALVSALIESKRNYVVIFPNNDLGAEEIFKSYRPLENHPNFRLFPSLRFESFLTLLKNAKSIIGNSSAGVREAPVYGVPSVNIGTRQQNRFIHPSIINSEYSILSILTAIQNAETLPKQAPCLHFGEGNSTLRFIEALTGSALWLTKKQKQFLDFPIQL